MIGRSLAPSSFLIKDLSKPGTYLEPATTGSRPLIASQDNPFEGTEYEDIVREWKDLLANNCRNYFTDQFVDILTKPTEVSEHHAANDEDAIRGTTTEVTLNANEDENRDDDVGEKDNLVDSDYE
ncbi:hypothetical protein Adt_39676 [Abeliophyllum distichum]|uniref:Uncharacterized protein n=1 Tax=Abeliophyllum distichum TaxID=126358 RepID=A0ABD1Q5S0_9LAMI